MSCFLPAFFEAFSHQCHPAHQTSDLWGCFSTAKFTRSKGIRCTQPHSPGCWPTLREPPVRHRLLVSLEATPAAGNRCCACFPQLMMSGRRGHVGKKMTSWSCSGNQSPLLAMRAAGREPRRSTANDVFILVPRYRRCLQALRRRCSVRSQPARPM